MAPQAPITPRRCTPLRIACFVLGCLSLLYDAYLIIYNMYITITYIIPVLNAGRTVSGVVLMPIYIVIRVFWIIMTIVGLYGLYKKRLGLVKVYLICGAILFVIRVADDVRFFIMFGSYITLAIVIRVVIDFGLLVSILVVYFLYYKRMARQNRPMVVQDPSAPMYLTAGPIHNRYVGPNYNTAVYPELKNLSPKQQAQDHTTSGITAC